MLQTLPQVLTDYVDTGKVQVRLRRLSNRAAPSGCVRAHTKRPAAPATRASTGRCTTACSRTRRHASAAQFTAQARALGLDEAKFGACLNGGVHAAAIRASVERMQQLGVGGTPLTLIGLTPAPGAPMKVVSSIYGARPYADFKAAIDAALARGALVSEIRSRRVPGRTGWTRSARRTRPPSSGDRVRQSGHVPPV